MEVEGGQTKPKRVALSAATLDQARAELEKVRTENRAGKLALPGRRSSFPEFADEYLTSVTHGQKSAGTRRAERVILGYWKTKNADLLKLYLWCLTLSGAREKEALRIRWSDVDFENRQVTIGTDGLAKNARHRGVNFSHELETLLREMREGRQPDSTFLFPSAQRGSKDVHARSLRESLTS
jgi:integrase